MTRKQCVDNLIVIGNTSNDEKIKRTVELAAELLMSDVSSMQQLNAQITKYKKRLGIRD